MSHHPAIDAEEVAKKFQSLHTSRGAFFAVEVEKSPRLLEAILFVQWHSLKPDGLVKLATELVNLYPQGLGCSKMVAAGVPKSGAYSLGEVLPIWQEMKALELNFVSSTFDPRQRHDFNRFLETVIVSGSTEAELRRYHGKELQAGLERFNYGFLKEAAVAAASWDLPGWLYALCARDDGNHSAPNYFTGLPKALIAMMDRQAAGAEGGIAQTAIKEKVFQRLEFAEDKSFPVIVLGDARIGKTASGSAWCQMRPGQRRLVVMPETNRDWDFLAALADSLGVPYSSQTSERALKRSVEFVLQHVRPFLVFDEFHYAIPVRANRRSVPHRLNWIRAHIVDKGLGCAFFATRQTFDATMDKFVRDTKYQMEQWIGRIAAPLVLDPVLEPGDLLNIAQSLFPSLDANVLGDVVGRCIELEEEENQKNGGRHTVAGAALRYLRQVASYAQWRAEKAGLAVGLPHIDMAWKEITGRDPVVIAPAPVSRTVRAGAATKSRETMPPKAGSGRGTRPVAAETAEIFEPEPTLAEG